MFQANKLQRFVYYVVQNLRMDDYQSRHWTSVMKLKHYLNFSLYLYRKLLSMLDLTAIGNKHQFIFNQVILAYDPENVYLFKNYYDDNQWPLSFEIEYESESSQYTYTDHMEVEGLNLLNAPVMPTTDDVRDNAAEYIQENEYYINITNDDDEAEIDDYEINNQIVLPKNDLGIMYLNSLLSDDDVIDMHDDEDFSKVSNSALKDWVTKMFEEYRIVAVHGDVVDTEGKNVSEDYAKFLENSKISPEYIAEQLVSE